MRGKRYLHWLWRFGGIVAAVVVVLCGCTTQQTSGVIKPGRVSVAPSARFEPGPIFIACPSAPAGFSFEQAQGRTKYASDGAANAANSVLNPPNMHEPGLEFAAGPIGFVLAPFAATYGALSAHGETMTPDKLSASESDLKQTMEEMSNQERLRDFVLQAAGEKIHRRVVPLESTESSSPGLMASGMLLETRLEELRLERRASNDTSFGLRIKARARLSRLPDRALLYEQPFEYQSGTALFVDWACPQAFQGVADTGIRELASYIADQVFSNATEAPLVVGAGYKRNPTRSAAPTTLVSNNAGYEPTPRLRLTAFPEGSAGQLGIYSTGTVAHFTLQRPLTRDDAVAEALSDVSWSLDDLQYSRNSVVQVAACGVAIPMSLWKQTAAAVRGLSQKEYFAAEAQLSMAAQETLPHEELALEVVQQLAPRVTQPVALVRRPPVNQSDQDPELMHCLAHGTLARLPEGETPRSYLVSQGTATALEIHVVSAALEGKSGINPPLALCVEAQATLYRVSDGAELYSCPIQYKSESRKFVEWAAGDSKLFRQEVRRCYRQMGSVLVEALVDLRVLTPEKTPQPILANK